MHRSILLVALFILSTFLPMVSNPAGAENNADLNDPDGDGLTNEEEIVYLVIVDEGEK